MPAFFSMMGNGCCYCSWDACPTEGFHVEAHHTPNKKRAQRNREARERDMALCRTDDNQSANPTSPRSTRRQVPSHLDMEHCSGPATSPSVEDHMDVSNAFSDSVFDKGGACPAFSPQLPGPGFRDVMGPDDDPPPCAPRRPERGAQRGDGRMQMGIEDGIGRAARRALLPPGYRPPHALLAFLLHLPAEAFAPADIQRMLAHHSPEPEGPLPEEDQLALFVYCYELTDSAGRSLPRQIYGELHEAMRKPAAPGFRVWMPFMYYLQRALEGLPSFVGTAYRVVNVGFPPAAYQPGSFITWPSFSSCSAALPQAGVATRRAFDAAAAGPPPGPRTVFLIRSVSARSVAPFSDFEAEAEVVFLPHSVFRVLDRVRSGVLRAMAGATDVISLEEVPERKADVLHRMEGAKPRAQAPRATSWGAGRRARWQGFGDLDPGGAAGTSTGGEPSVRVGDGQLASEEGTPGGSQRGAREAAGPANGTGQERAGASAVRDEGSGLLVGDARHGALEGTPPGGLDSEKWGAEALEPAIPGDAGHARRTGSAGVGIGAERRGEEWCDGVVPTQPEAG